MGLVDCEEREPRIQNENSCPQWDSNLGLGQISFFFSVTLCYETNLLGIAST